MKKTMQSKFEAAMLNGKSLTVQQISAIGFKNFHDPAYKARKHGMDIIRTERLVKGNKISRYSMFTGAVNSKV